MKIGEKIKELRVQNGLTQEELADRAELTKGFISQVERDLTSLSIATLMDVLECLGTNLRDFFSDLEEEKIVFTKEDVFVKDEEQGITIQWIVPNAQKNAMEPILIELAPGSSTAEDDPHSGEEFGYVLSGSVVVHLGQRKYRAKKGESFYYKTSTKHYLHNPGKSKAQVLWVAAPPNF
jgi:transcriptional regulator with XRE-family HTH domain